MSGALRQSRLKSSTMTSLTLNRDQRGQAFQLLHSEDLLGVSFSTRLQESNREQSAFQKNCVIAVCFKMTAFAEIGVSVSPFQGEVATAFLSTQSPFMHIFK